MPKERTVVREVREVRWIEEGWAEADGDGVMVYSISGGIEFRARCSWHEFIKYHMACKGIIADHMARSTVYDMQRNDGIAANE